MSCHFTVIVDSVLDKTQTDGDDDDDDEMMMMKMMMKMMTGMHDGDSD